MANTVNAVWVKQGPSFSFQQLALGGTDAQDLAYRGSATFTGDASTSVVTINFIDGVQTPFFTPGNPPVAVAPSLVIATVGKGATSANASGGVTAITTTGFTFQAQTAANWPATSFTIDFIVCP